MPECYKCLGESCSLNFTEMPTCFSSEFCFTQTKIHEHKDGHFSIYERGCENVGKKAQLSTCHLYNSSKKDIFHDLHLNCCDTNKCNNAPFQILLSQEHKPETINGLGTILTISIIFFSMILTVVMYFAYKRYQKRKKQKNNNEYEFSKVEDVEAGNDLSSGRCCSTMVARNLTKDIRLDTVIGQGRYGQVWKGKWGNDVVAVKILSTIDYASVQRERLIYQAMNMCISKYVLNFRVSDLATTKISESPEYWIITDYCPLGSLFDFLNQNVISLKSAISIINSILCGIHYLHQDMFRSSKKPSIAHRDIKSKNILMLTPTQCVIADFGLAVTHHLGGPLNVPVNYRIGTKRYMAPEILNNTFNPGRFESYLMADVYSVALVIWEIVHRIEELPNIKAQIFRVAYQDMVPPDPSFEEMQHVVSTENRRPKFESKESFSQNEALSIIMNMIEEAWKSKPMSRLNIFNMKRQIQKTNI